MDYKVLIDRILQNVRKDVWDSSAYADLYAVCKEAEETEFEAAHSAGLELRDRLMYAIRMTQGQVPELYTLYENTLLFNAPYDLDSYLLYLELDRKPDERFYQPRRKVLKRVVDAMQALVDGDMEELFVSMPPRVGKTTLIIFFCTWLMGKNSESSNLYSAFSDTITKAFYNGVLEVLTDPITYRWGKVFPGSVLVSTNAADETLNIDRRKRYPSLTCRSLYGTLNGACDCSGFLIADDLIGSIEEALNKDRLKSTWDKVDNNLLTRAKQQAKILWVGTRWSLVDPIGIRMELIENDERFKSHKYQVINLPAMDENDESNFDYDYGVGFSTQKYRERRASFERNNDMASWNAQYMGEPIERDGSLFAPNDFEYYNGVLPSDEADRVFVPVDPAYGGGDFVAAPCCVMVGEKIYVPDLVYDQSDKRITQPKVAAMAQKYGVTSIRVEGSKATVAYKEGLSAELDKLGHKCLVTSKANAGRGAQSKLERIMAVAPDIRERYVFLEPGCRSREYERFLQNVFSLTIVGRNKHDDAPDSLAMGIDMVGKKNKASIFRRPI